MSFADVWEVRGELKVHYFVGSNYGFVYLWLFDAERISMTFSL